MLFSSLCAVYVLAAGYWGVVITDFQQGVIAFASIVLVSAWGIAGAGGPNGIIARLEQMGEGWRLDMFHFTGWLSGDFPVAWFMTMVVFAFLGGIGMATTIDWYAEAQRIQSAKTIRDASYSIWAGIVASAVMYWIIDPKLRAISEEYERKQKEYLERVEKLVRWEKQG